MTHKASLSARTALLPLTVMLLGLSCDASAQGDFPDPLLSTAMTPETVVAGNEVDAYVQGVQAYIWGYPLVRMERVARQYTTVPPDNPPTSYRAPLNRIGWARDLATPAAKDMPTANNDTFYMSSVVRLDEPYIFSVPDTHDRYYVVNVFNMWQELEHYIGRRTTGTKAGKFALTPTGWKGRLPAGVKRLDVTTDKVWLWGRLRYNQGEDKNSVLALQNQFTLVPLSRYGKPDAKVAAASPLPALPAIGDDELGFFLHLAAALKANSVRPADKALFAQFARIGLTANGFDASKLSPERRKALVRALKDGPSAVASAFATAAVLRNGWSWATGLDTFGLDYPLRALVAGPYLGGNGEKEALYPLRYADAGGQVLTGANKYTVKFDHQPPVNAFWSLTVYNSADKMLIENPISRYKLGSDTPGIVTASDGSLTVRLQHDTPSAEAAKNWLPTPAGPFYVILRLYQPGEEIMSGAYQLPQIVREP